MKWKAASHQEAGNVLGNIAKHGYRILEQLDHHLEAHCARNDKVFDPDKIILELAPGSEADDQQKEAVSG